MNILLLVLQIFLALHTAIGAVWKFSHSAEETMPTLSAIPDGIWHSMSVVELLCSAALIIPLFYRPIATLAPIAAIIIIAEMLLFTGLHLAAGNATLGPIIYWLIVAAVCAFVAYGRFVLNPI